MFIRRKFLKKIYKVCWRELHSDGDAKRRVVVTGIGAVTPLGNNIEITWKKLLNKECGITELKDDIYKNLPCRVAAQINRDTLNIEENFSKTDLKTMSPATMFALMATKEALTSANLLPQNEKYADNIGVCIGMGMIDLADIYNSYQSFLKGYNRISPYFVPRILPNMAGGHISIKYGFRGPIHTVSTACATGAHAIGDGFRFIKNNYADIMVCGAGEASIEPLSIAGFCRLRALSTSFNDEPSKASRPFDKHRDGFVMGEGSAILILEELNHAKERNANIYAEVLGYGLSGDAYHLTSPNVDGSGASLAMKRALKDSNINCEGIKYINAHATSTPTGDKIEAKAIKDTFGSYCSKISVSSTKGAHGHLLGSSGNLETAFVVLACRDNQLPPSLNIENVEDDLDLQFVKETRPWDTTKRRIALKNSFGFGGTNACLCIAQYIK